MACAFERHWRARLFQRHGGEPPQGFHCKPYYYAYHLPRQTPPRAPHNLSYPHLVGDAHPRLGGRRAPERLLPQRVVKQSRLIGKQEKQEKQEKQKETTKPDLTQQPQQKTVDPKQKEAFEKINAEFSQWLKNNSSNPTRE